MWIQLLRSCQLEQHGVSRTYYPGDWVEVGKQTAQRWILDGAARAASHRACTDDLTGCGVALLGNLGAAARLQTHAPQLALEPVVEPSLLFAKTLLWNTGFSLRPELAPVGFRLLARWEVAAPIVSYDQLACHIGTEAARERTAAVVRDLRVPLYEPRLLFVRRCAAGRDLLAAWREEEQTGDDERLCLLRALYRVKPLVCALPVTWNKSVPAIP